MAAVNVMSSVNKCLCTGITEVLLLQLWRKVVNFSARSTNSRKLFKDELDVDDNTYGGVYISFSSICRFIVYFVVISCLVHHLLSLSSNLCFEKVEHSLLGQVSKKPKDLPFLTAIFSFICWGVR